MERQLREAHRWFAHTLQCVADGVIVTDLKGRVRFLNPAAEQLTGWSLDDAVGQVVGNVVCLRAGGAELPDATVLVAQVVRDGRALPVAHAQTLLPRVGAQRSVDDSAGPVNDDAGQRLGAVLVLRDAAPRLAQEALLRASEARFRSTFDFAPLGMVLVSFAGEFIQVNDAMCRLLGLSRSALQGHTHTELTLAGDREHEAQRLRDLSLTEAGVVQFEKRYLRVLGEPVWALVSVSMLRNGDEPSCHLYQVHDLTEQKRAADHLALLADERMRRQASELATAAKTDFLSRVSHEMRTPLNAVMGFAQLLQMQQLAPEPASVGRYANHIHVAGEHLLALVTDLLDLNSAAQGTLKLQTAPLVLADAVREALNLIQGQADEHGIDIDTQVAGDLRVMADAQRLREVLLNLVSNAIKYNRQGGKVQLRAARVSEVMVELRIEDHGIGMTREQLDHLFQPFERLGAERTKIPGTGLGLVISRSLVVEMGGTLSVACESRSGTTVTLALRAP